MRDVWRPESRAAFAGPVLIDTHIWIWLLGGVEDRLTPATVALLDRCVAGAGIYVSEISVWELGTKVVRGKLSLGLEVGHWIRESERAPGTGFLPLDREVLLLSTRLPGTAHGDPADRMLIAAARLRRWPLLTADVRIIEYAEARGGLSVCDARM